MVRVADGTSNTMSYNRHLYTHSTGCELQSVQALANLHKTAMRSSIFLGKILALKGSSYKIGSSRSKEASSYLPIYSCSFPELHSLEMLFKTILETLAKHCRSKAQLTRPATCSKAGFTQTSSAVRQFPPMEPSKILARPSIKTVWSLETCWGVSVSHCQSSRESVPRMHTMDVYSRNENIHKRWQPSTPGKLAISQGHMWFARSQSTYHIPQTNKVEHCNVSMALLVRGSKHERCQGLRSKPFWGKHYGKRKGLTFFESLNMFSRIFVCISPLFGPTLKKSPWRASQRPINCDWCWWLPEIACLLSLTSWPRPKWIKVECNAVEIHWKMSSHGQTRTVWHPQKGSNPSDSSGQVTRSEPARSTTLSLGDSVTPGLLMVCWSASQHFLECIPSPLPAWLWWDDLTQNRVCNICCSEVWDLAMVHSTFCPVFAASKTRSRLEIRSWKIAWLRLEAFEKSRSQRLEN